MIHFILGTRAEFIKTAPVLKELDLRGIKYSLISTGQHQGGISDIIKTFDLKKPDIELSGGSGEIVTFYKGFFWVLKSVLNAVFRRSYVLRDIFRGEKGLCVVQGDTLSTLIGLIYAKLCGLRVAWIEAGYRSFDYFNPFPEEIVRIILSRYADILFASSSVTYENVERISKKSNIINTKANTVLDAISYVVGTDSQSIENEQEYVLVSMHRFETIYSKKRLELLVSLIKKIASERRIIFVAHKPTVERLMKMGMYSELSNLKNISIRPVIGYAQFGSLLKNASFVVTDSGGVQMESFYLGIPCLILREKTEIPEGLGENAYLSEFKKDRIDHFLKNIDKFKTKSKFDESPSKIIADVLEEYK